MPKLIKFILIILVGPKWIRLYSIAFLIFLLITALALVVNTQTPHLSSNSPILFNLSGSYDKQAAFSYKNYDLIPIWPSLTAFFYPAGRSPTPFFQSGLTNYFSQATTRWSLDAAPPFLWESGFFAYQKPFTYFDYKPVSMQNWQGSNFDTSPFISYMPVMEYIPSVLSSGYYPSIYYPRYDYGQKPSAPAMTNLSQQESEIIGTIGIITDIHYTDKDSTDRRFRFSLSGPRFYSEAGDDLAGFVNKMNSMGVNAVIELGDFIDIHSGNSLYEGNSNIHDDGAHGELILFEAESIYSKLNMPYYHVIGNWDMYDYDFATAQEWFRYIINGTPDTIRSLGGKLYTDAIGNPVSRYYSFKFGGVLGISLDSSGSCPLGDNYLMNTRGIDGTGYIPENQLKWLEGVLEENRSGENRPVIIFIHTLLYPVFRGNNYYMCKNHSAVRDILEADENVIAVFNGHHHPGAQNWWEDIYDDPYSNVHHAAIGVFGVKHNGIKYFNLRGSIIGWGSDPAGPIEKPSNVYYVLTVKKGRSICVEVVYSLA